MSNDGECVWRLSARRAKYRRLDLALRIRLKLALVLSLAALAAYPARATEWRWSFHGPGVSGSGGFTTGDKADPDGFSEITRISGEVNGVAITGLQAAGTAIPGNEGYPVDSLVRMAEPQLSKNGFGYALADGSYANPFYGAHFAKPDFYLFISDPKTGKTNEPAIVFSATKAGPGSGG